MNEHVAMILGFQNEICGLFEILFDVGFWGVLNIKHLVLQDTQFSFTLCFCKGLSYGIVQCYGVSDPLGVKSPFLLGGHT